MTADATGVLAGEPHAFHPGEIDEYCCPEADCDFVVAAVGPLPADMDDDFADEIEEHRRSHAARPYRVGDRVRVRSDQGNPWNEGPVYQIDDQGFLFIKTAPWVQHDGTEVDVDFVIMNDDRTDALYTYEIELLEPAPTIPSDGAVTSTPAPSGVPSLVELDRHEARARVLDAAFIYEDAARGGDVAAELAARDALLAAVRECRKAVSR